MKRALALTFMLFCGSFTPGFALSSGDIGPVTDEAQATRYLDAVFQASQCHLSEAALLVQMRADGQSPSDLDRANPSVNTSKLMRHRWVFKTLQDLIASGSVCPDASDPAATISKFGGCA